MGQQCRHYLRCRPVHVVSHSCRHNNVPCDVGSRRHDSHPLGPDDYATALMVIKFRAAQHHLTIVVAHAPTAGASEEARSSSYTSLSDATSAGNEMDTTIALIDANAGPGASRSGWEPRAYLKNERTHLRAGSAQTGHLLNSMTLLEHWRVHLLHRRRGCNPLLFGRVSLGVSRKAS